MSYNPKLNKSSIVYATGSTILYLGQGFDGRMQIFIEDLIKAINLSISPVQAEY
jgi:hypothetical protein